MAKRAKPEEIIPKLREVEFRLSRGETTGQPIARPRDGSKSNWYDSAFVHAQLGDFPPVRQQEPGDTPFKRN